MSHAPHAMRHEHEFEPEYGLPERLPAHETKLWQGSPDAWQVTRRVFHWNKLALYFGVITAWRVATLLGEGASSATVLQALVQLLPLFGLCLALLGLVGWLTARTTVYTLTDRRVVLRVGIVLTVTYNLPLRSIDAAHLHPLGSGFGDIALALKSDTRIAYLHLWPHVRPWRYVRTQPMLRALPDAQRTAELLAQAWASANQQTAQADVASAPAGRPATRGLGPAALARG
jgi:hypothetical protein